MKETEYIPHLSGLAMQFDMPICQTDYPLDSYQEEFKPYAEEFLALPDRRLETILKWMKRYVEPAQAHFGNQLLLLAHYYMGGEIVKLIEYFGGEIGDSYQLALKAREHPEKKIIVESAVHFMAESIGLLANPDQAVYITNPKAGCTMEMYAKDYMVEPALLELNARYGVENILPVCYMNTSGRVKALTGAQGGAVCTSGNVLKIFQWAIKQKKKILFIPDKNMGENIAHWAGIPQKEIAYWPGGIEATRYRLNEIDSAVQAHFDTSPLILFSSLCGVHDYYRADMVNYWKEQGYNVVAHPECRLEVMLAADACGSTALIVDHVLNDRGNTKHYAVATENHMVENLKEAGALRGITVVNVAEAKISYSPKTGCGCATMSRNDPPHLVGLLDLLYRGKAPEYNRVLPGDVVNEFSGARQRLNEKEREWIAHHARIALENMVRITEG